MTRVRVHHLRQLGYCMRGARRWMRRHGWDWGHFVRDGVDAGELRATGDAMAVKAADVAEADRGR